MTAYLGIDVSKDKLDVVLVRDRHPAESGQFDNERTGFYQLRHFLQKRQVQSLHTCLEVTGYYGEALATYLYEMGYAVSVVNPAHIKSYADSRLNRTTTGVNNAALIADFCRTQHPPVWTPPAPGPQDVKALVRQLANLTEMRQQEANHRPAVVSLWGRFLRLNRGQENG